MSLDETTITVQLNMPNLWPPIRKAITISPFEAAPLQPLSRNHDFAPDAIAVFAGSRQIIARAKLVRHIADELAKAIEAELHERDPYNGYDRAELRAQLKQT